MTGHSWPADGTAHLLVLAATPGTTVQDLGRSGLTAWGIARAGAADRASLRLANRLVGNEEGAAALECPLGGVSLVGSTTTVVAVTGAPCPVYVDGRAHGLHSAVLLPAGQRLDVGVAGFGLRTYVAVRGGLDLPVVLGSRSRDTLGGVGPEPVGSGSLLPLGQQAGCAPAWFDQAVTRRSPAGPTTVRAVLGPRDDWFPASSIRRFFAELWSVNGHSDRVGLRLDGPALARRPGELASEPMLPGAVQVPSSGQPIVLGPDCGTTGGYPVIAVVVDEDLDLLGQLRPGDHLKIDPLQH